MKKFSGIVKIGTVIMLVAWFVVSLAGLMMLSREGEGSDEKFGEKVGHFGDFFGCFNALVNVLGFSAVIYSLLKQDELSEQEEARHRDITSKQVAAAEQNTRLALFEKRHDSYQTVLKFINIARVHGDYNDDDFINLSQGTKFAKFLFTNGTQIQELISNLSINGHLLKADNSRLNKTPANEASVKTTKDRIEDKKIWFMNQVALLEQLTEVDLYLGNNSINSQ